MNDPGPVTQKATRAIASAREGQAAPHSMRSRRTATWARPRGSDDGYSRYLQMSFYRSIRRLFYPLIACKAIEALVFGCSCSLTVYTIYWWSIVSKVKLVEWSIIEFWIGSLFLVLSYCFCSDSILRSASSDLKKMGQRIFVFIIGGATRSEVYFFQVHVLL